MSFTADELECLQHELCECEEEYDPSGAYSMVIAKCLNCQFIDAIEQKDKRIEQLEAENEQVRKDLMDAIDQIPDTTP